LRTRRTPRYDGGRADFFRIAAGERIVPALMTQSHGDVTVVSFTDSKILDEQKINQLSDELNRVADRCAGGKLLLSFDGVTFMSSAVLGKLVSINRKCQENGTKLKMCQIAPDIMKVFEITRLNKVIDIYDTEEKALSAYNKRGWFS
jgi:anti-sigma B factor antagonist